MESEMETIVPETPPSRYRSRSPILRRSANRSLFRRELVSPISDSTRLGSDSTRLGSDSTRLGSDPVLAFKESETVEPETVLPLDDSDAVVPEPAFLFDDSIPVVPEMIRLFDESETVVPETVLPFEESDTILPILPQTVCSTSTKIRQVGDDVIARTMRPKSDRVYLELLAIYCPAVLTLL